MHLISNLACTSLTTVSGGLLISMAVLTPLAKSLAKNWMPEQYANAIYEIINPALAVTYECLQEPIASSFKEYEFLEDIINPGGIGKALSLGIGGFIASSLDMGYKYITGDADYHTDFYYIPKMIARVSMIEHIKTMTGLHKVLATFAAELVFNPNVDFTEMPIKAAGSALAQYTALRLSPPHDLWSAYKYNLLSEGLKLIWKAGYEQVKCTGHNIVTQFMLGGDAAYSSSYGECTQKIYNSDDAVCTAQNDWCNDFNYSTIFWSDAA